MIREKFEKNMEELREIINGKEVTDEHLESLLIEAFEERFKDLRRSYINDSSLPILHGLKPAFGISEIIITDNDWSIIKSRLKNMATGINRLKELVKTIVSVDYSGNMTRIKDKETVNLIEFADSVFTYVVSDKDSEYLRPSSYIFKLLDNLENVGGIMEFIDEKLPFSLDTYFMRVSEKVNYIIKSQDYKTIDIPEHMINKDLINYDKEMYSIETLVVKYLSEEFKEMLSNVGPLTQHVTWKLLDIVKIVLMRLCIIEAHKGYVSIIEPAMRLTLRKSNQTVADIFLPEVKCDIETQLGVNSFQSALSHKFSVGKVKDFKEVKFVSKEEFSEMCYSLKDYVKICYQGEPTEVEKDKFIKYLKEKIKDRYIKEFTFAGYRDALPGFTTIEFNTDNEAPLIADIIKTIPVLFNEYLERVVVENYLIDAIIQSMLNGLFSPAMQNCMRFINTEAEFITSLKIMYKNLSFKGRETNQKEFIEKLSEFIKTYTNDTYDESFNPNYAIIAVGGEIDVMLTDIYVKTIAKDNAIINEVSDIFKVIKDLILKREFRQRYDLIYFTVGMLNDSNLLLAYKTPSSFTR